MKIRSFLTVVAMLSVFLIGAGAAYAVTGIADDVPGQDVGFPIICEGFQPNSPAGDPVGGPVFGPLNTIWAIAETSGPSCVSDNSVCTPATGSASSVGVVRATAFVFNRLSQQKLDIPVCWSRRDIVSDHCQGLISLMDATNRDAMEVTIGGITYFAGYVIYQVPSNGSCTGSPFNTLVPWVYLTDIASGFAAGFNGISFENGVGPELEETCIAGTCAGNTIGVTAHTLYPRYFILNNDPETFNWWIFWLGRNEYNLEPVPSNNIHRQLTCFFCDEAEHCISNNVPIPHELNIINVNSFIPGGIFLPGVFPKAGFAQCTIDERGFFTGTPNETIIAGTLSVDGVDGAPNSDPETYSLFGWSYQRAIPADATEARVAAMHPVHRLYCANSGQAIELPNRFVVGENTGNCTLVNPFLTPVVP